MPRGSKPGEYRGGRKKGTRNKATVLAHDTFLHTFRLLVPDLKRWIQETAEGVEVDDVNDLGEPIKVKRGANPAKAAELTVRLAEFHYPKRAAVALTGEDGGPVRAIFKIEEP